MVCANTGVNIWLQSYAGCFKMYETKICNWRSLFTTEKVIANFSFRCSDRNSFWKSGITLMNRVLQRSYNNPKVCNFLIHLLRQTAFLLGGNFMRETDYDNLRYKSKRKWYQLGQSLLSGEVGYFLLADNLSSCGLGKRFQFSTSIALMKLFK